MIDFHSVELKDREWICDILRQTETCNCEFSFANLFTWGNAYGKKVAKVCDCLCTVDGKGRFTMPIGKRRFEALDLLQKETGEKMQCLLSVSEEDIPLLHDKLGAFEVHFDRRWSDYVYESVALDTLQGRKLAAKRNHINAFVQNNEWHTAPITVDNLEEVKGFNDLWCSLYGCGQDESLRTEICMVRKCLDNFDALALSGLILYANDQMVAYSFGEALSASCFVVHAEKALAEVRGAYPMINRSFVQTYCKDFTFVNREDDSGDEGLRKAKLSYQPAMILHKNFIIWEK